MTPRPTRSTHARGRAAERAAARWLEKAGYRLLERNVRSPLGEIDLVALDGETLCFVEVKARRRPVHGRAVESLSPRQRSRLARAAALYLQRHPHDGPCRFDLLGMEEAGGSWDYELIRDAFPADASP